MGFGELVLDKVYNEKLELLFENGGCPVFNVCYNLGLIGEKVFAIRYFSFVLQSNKKKIRILYVGLYLQVG